MIQHLRLLSMYLEKVETIIKKVHVPQVLIAALFTVARAWKQPRGPSADEWTEDVQYYSTIKKSEKVPFAAHG